MTPLNIALSYAAAGGGAPYTANIEDLDWSRRPQHRYRCSKSTNVAALGKVICSNGSIQYKAYCMECGGKGTNIPYSQVEGLDSSRIKVITEHEIIPCERCGSEEGSEVHHWAPAHLFDDWLDWPTSHLCRKCHREWHSVVTPNMSARRKAA